MTSLVIAHLEREAQQRIEPAFPTSSLLANYNTSASAGNKQATTSSVVETNISSAGPSSRPDVSQGRLAQSLEGETFLNAIKGTWEDHKVCMGKLRDVLKYMVSLLALAAIVQQANPISAGQVFDRTKWDGFNLYTRSTSVPGELYSK